MPYTNILAAYAKLASGPQGQRPNHPSKQPQRDKNASGQSNDTCVETKSFLAAGPQEQRPKRRSEQPQQDNNVGEPGHPVSNNSTELIPAKKTPGFSNSQLDKISKFEDAERRKLPLDDDLSSTIADEKAESDDLSSTIDSDDLSSTISNDSDTTPKGSSAFIAANKNKPPMRHKNGDGNFNEILHSIPWGAVFQFLDGEAVAKALMASKHQNPWKMELLVDRNEQQCIVSALKDRMMSTENGKRLLQLYYNNRPQFLPKLLYCMDHGYDIRYDGVYQGGLGNESCFYFRFYPTGEIIFVCSYDDVALVWPWFDKDSEIVRSYAIKGTFECKFIPGGPNLFQLTSTINLAHSMSIGQNGELIQTELGRSHTFVKL